MPSFKCGLASKLQYLRVHTLLAIIALLLYYRITSIMISRSPSKLVKPITKYRRFTQATATLRLSPNKAQQVQCRVEGAPYYSVVVPKSVGCGLAGRDLGSQAVKVDLIFYGGCHLAYGIPSYDSFHYFLKLSQMTVQNPRV